MPWIISDDGSTDGTLEYLDGLSHFVATITNSKQTGITRAMCRLINVAYTTGDIILYVQNDWRQTRHIDFTAIAQFYASYPNTGHIATVKYKGENKTRGSAYSILLNLHTREPIMPQPAIKVGNESILPGNWHYADIPGFTSLKFAKQMFKDMVFCQNSEGIRNKNIHESGCDNYFLEDQPFENMDSDMRNITRGRMY